MFQLLFNPSGYIDSQEFRKGAVLLLALNFFMWAGWYGGPLLGSLLGMVSVITIYCWACLFIKRLADGEKSGLWFIPIFIAFFMLAYFLFAIFVGLLAPEVATLSDEMRQLDPFDTSNQQAVTEATGRLYKSIAIPGAIAFFLAGSMIAFSVNSRIKTSG